MDPDQKIPEDISSVATLPVEGVSTSDPAPSAPPLTNDQSSASSPSDPAPSQAQPEDTPEVVSPAADAHPLGVLQKILEAAPQVADVVGAHALPSAPSVQDPTQKTEAAAEQVTAQAVPAQAAEAPNAIDYGDTDPRIEKLAAQLDVTPEALAKFRRDNPAFANDDDTQVEPAYRELTAAQQLKRSDDARARLDAVEPIPTAAPYSIWHDVRAIPSAVVAGGIKSALESYDALNEIAMGNPPNPGGWRQGFEDYYENIHGISGVAATIAQWGVAFVGIGKFTRLAGIAKAAEGVKGGQAALAVAKGMGADFLAFDGHGKRLSDLVQSNPVFGEHLANPITAALSSSPDDSEAMGRMKNALEGAGLGAVTDVIVHGVRAIRAARAGDRVAAEAATQDAEKSFEALNTGVRRKMTTVPDSARPSSLDASPSARNAPPEADNLGTGSNEGTHDAPAGDAPKPAQEQPQFSGPLDQGKLQAAAREIAGDLITDPSKRTLWFDPPINSPTPSTFDSLTHADDLRSVIKATEDEILKGMEGSESSKGPVSIATSTDLAADFARMTGSQPGEFLARMQEDVGTQAQLHARLLSYDQTTRTLAAGIRDMAVAIKAQTPGVYGTMDELTGAFETRLAQYAQVQDFLKGIRSGTGRALNVMKYTADVGERIPGTLMGDSSMMRGASVSDVVDAVLAAGTDRGRLAKVADPSTYSRLRDALTSLFIKNILSGHATHLTNILGNTFAALTHPAAKIVGGTLHLDSPLATQGFKQYAYMVTEAHHALQYAVEGFKRNHQLLDRGNHGSKMGFVEGLDAERLGIDPTSITGKLLNGYTTGLDAISTRSLEAADEFFKQIVYSSEVMSRSYTDGINKGLTGNALKGYVQQQRTAHYLSDGSANLDAPYAQAGLQTAREQTFTQAPVSRPAKIMMSATQTIPELKFAVPFVRVVNNIMSYAGAMTPGFHKMSAMYQEAVARGGQDAAVAQGRLALGAALWTSATAMAHAGLLTGPGPLKGDGSPDFPKRQELQQTGWRPHSLRVGDTYIPLDKMDPVGFPFVMAGEFIQRWDKSDDHSAANAAALMALTLSHSMLDRSFLQGLSSLMDAFNDPTGDRLQKYSADLVGSLLVPNAVRQGVTEQVDPYVHEARGFIENIQRRLPWASEDLAVRRLPWGEKMTLRPKLYDKQISDDPLLNEFARALQAGEGGVPAPLPRIGRTKYSKGVDLARTRLRDGTTLYDLYGDTLEWPDPELQPLRAKLTDLVKSDDYKRLIDGPAKTSGTKMHAFNQVIGAYKQAAWRRIKEDYPEANALLHPPEISTPPAASTSLEEYVNE